MGPRLVSFDGDTSYGYTATTSSRLSRPSKFMRKRWRTEAGVRGGWGLVRRVGRRTEYTILSWRDTGSVGEEGGAGEAREKLPQSGPIRHLEAFRKGIHPEYGYVGADSEGVLSIWSPSGSHLLPSPLPPPHTQTHDSAVPADVHRFWLCINCCPTSTQPLSPAGATAGKV